MATDNKYDRQVRQTLLFSNGTDVSCFEQLRLWGAKGQEALMNASILVLGSGPTATETLKNLVLPGIGRFAMVDSAMVEHSDLGNNFFVDSQAIGRSRAAVRATC
jgi:amyloid beta precursor protein binding protein 1